MFTKEQLNQLKEVIQAENEPINKKLDGLGGTVTTLLQGQARLEKAVEPVYNRLNSLDQGLHSVEQTQAQTNTALNAIGAGHQDLTERVKTIQEKMATKKDVEATVEAAKLEVKADILTLNAGLVRKVQAHEKRIENLEETTHTPNPTKN